MLAPTWAVLCSCASLVPRACRPSDARRSSGLRRLSLGLSDALRRLSLHGDLPAAGAAPSSSSSDFTAGPADQAGALPQPCSLLWRGLVFLSPCRLFPVLALRALLSMTTTACY